MLSSLEALDKVEANVSATRSSLFKPTVKPRARKPSGPDSVLVLKDEVKVTGEKDTSFCPNVSQNASGQDAHAKRIASTDEQNITSSTQRTYSPNVGTPEATAHEEIASYSEVLPTGFLPHECSFKHKAVLTDLAENAAPSTGTSPPFSSRSAMQLPTVDSAFKICAAEVEGPAPQVSPVSLMHVSQTSSQNEEALDNQKANSKRKGRSVTETIGTRFKEQSSEDINEDQTSLQNEQMNSKSQKGRKKKGGSTTAAAMVMDEEEQSRGSKIIGENKTKNTETGNEVKRTSRRKIPHRSIQRKRRAEKTLDMNCSDPTHLSMKQIIWWAEAKEKKKLKETTLQSKGTPNSHSIPQQNTGPSRQAEKRAEMAPQVQIIDGQIVINEQSLTISANAANKDDLQTYRRVDENSSKLNYHSYMKRTVSERWNSEETELFYKAVGQFGTDFALIQNLFPGRTRRQIKAKFKKEDRLNPFRINASLEQRSKDYLQYKEVIDILKASSQKEAEADLFDYQLDAYITDPTSTQAGSKRVDETVLLHPEIPDSDGYAENDHFGKLQDDPSKIVDTAGQFQQEEQRALTDRARSKQRTSKVVDTAGQLQYEKQRAPTERARTKQKNSYMNQESALSTDFTKDTLISDPLSSYEDTEPDNPLFSYA